MTSPGTDYQWPSVSLPLAAGSATDSAEEVRATQRIEAFFSARHGVTATLLPSGRAAIAALLDFLGASRAHVVFAPRWSSHCVWDVIGRVANPTISFEPQPDFILAVHKWGYCSALATSHPGALIEDSADSLIRGKRGLFPLAGKFEIISLPKLIGSYAGGIVLSRDAAFHEFVSGGRERGRWLAEIQSALKRKRLEGGLLPGESDHALEALNRALCGPDLQDIERRLPGLDINATVISRRLPEVLARFAGVGPDPSNDRLPPLYPVPVRTHDSRMRGRVMIRHFDLLRTLDQPRYEPCWLVPLHFGVDESAFRGILESIVPR